MQYIDPTTGLSVGIYNIRAAHPHISIPDGADLTDLGYALIVQTPIPELQPGEFATPGSPIETENGWEETWVVNPRPIPFSVSKSQAIEALAHFGFLDTVEAFMSNPDTPAQMKRAWTYATEFMRESPAVAVLAGILGLDKTQLDNLFIFASNITA